MPKRKSDEIVESSSKRFRAQYKTFGLTYSRCPLERNIVVHFLLSKIDVVDYYCVRETHKEKGDCPYHIHVWFNVGNKPNIKTNKFFDIEDGGKVYHPNIGNKKRNWIWNYLKKQDDQPLTNIAEGYVELAKAGEYEMAVQKFSDDHPKEFVINYERVLRNLRQMSRKPRQEHVYPFTGGLYDYDDAQVSLYIKGPAGCGKTEWAKSYVVHHKKSTYLRVNHMDKLKQYNNEDYIIFDDISFLHIPRETQIQICEVKNSRDIHCRNVPAYIPPGVKNIFLCNEDCLFITDPAIERRLYRAPLISFY